MRRITWAEREAGREAAQAKWVEHAFPEEDLVALECLSIESSA